MDVLVKLTVPNEIYRFYHQASTHVADCSAEDIMSDALSAYAGLLSDDIGKKWEDILEGNISSSRSL